MANMNYFSGVVKILETPKPKILSNKQTVIQCRVQLPQVRGNRVVKLNVWGWFAKNTTNTISNYKVNDYILVEGYISLRSFSVNQSFSKMPKKIEISATKVYPFILNNSG